MHIKLLTVLKEDSGLLTGRVAEMSGIQWGHNKRMLSSKWTPRHGSARD